MDEVFVVPLSRAKQSSPLELILDRDVCLGPFQQKLDDIAMPAAL